MKFFKTLVFFCLFAFIAISVRLAVFGRGEAPKALESQALAAAEPVPSSPSVSLPDASSPSVSVPVASSPPQATISQDKPPLVVLGYVKRGQSINLWLSDGRFLTERDKELQEVRKNYAIIDGERVWFVRPSARDEARPQPLPATRSEAERSAPL